MQQTLNQGHRVTAFVRDPARLTVQHPNLRVAVGDIMPPQTVAAAMPHQEAVLSALDVSRSKAHDIRLSEGTRHIVEAMRQNGVACFICETSLGLGSSKGELGGLFEKLLVPLLLRHVMADKERQEQLIRQSGLRWPIVRPHSLTNGPRTSHYQAALSLAGRPIKHRIARADVADSIPHQPTDNIYLEQAGSISY